MSQVHKLVMNSQTLTSYELPKPQAGDDVWRGGVRRDPLRLRPLIRGVTLPCTEPSRVGAIFLRLRQWLLWGYNPLWDDRSDFTLRSSY